MAQVQNHQEATAIPLTHVGEYVAVRLHGRVRADGQRGLGATQREEAVMEGEHGCWIFTPGGDVVRPVIIGDREPGLTGREAGVSSLVPLHRCARGVAAETLPGDVLLEGVLDELWRYLYVAHPELVPVVEGWRAAQREK